MSILSGFFSLGRDVNKLDSDEAVDSSALEELELKLKDEEIVALTKQWEKQWEEYSPAIQQIQKENELYWLGEHFQGEQAERKLVDNLIFESLETFLPIATKPKAEPLVEGGRSPQEKQVVKSVSKMLVYVADIGDYNIKLKQVARFWALHLLGCMKVGWSAVDNEITFSPIRTSKLILDPEGIIEGAWFKGEYIGEEKRETASRLVKRFPKKEKFISEKASGKMGTRLKFREWWTPDYVCWILDGEVLGKSKNPHWNYPQLQQLPPDQFGQPVLDEQGNPVSVTVPGKNHFTTPRMPYIFLSIFNLAKRPHDETSLIQQNLPLQDLINLRLKQINKNANNANGGIAVSGDVFDKEQAKQAADTIRDGGAIFVPNGDVNSAVTRLVGTPLPDFIYQSLIDYRTELRNIFGVRGSSPQGTVNETTVRGKYMIQGQDMSRIGGGISIFLESFSDAFFNWLVQLMYIYYDETHEASILGEAKEEEMVSLSRSQLPTKLVVGVKEGSMIPKDPLAERNEAVELWGAGGIDPVTFFERLDFPNPREAALRLTMWRLDPLMLFPELAQMKGPPQPPPPSKSLKFADLPPEGQIQMAAQAGIQLTPEALIGQKVEQQLQEEIKLNQNATRRMASERSMA